MFYYDTSFFFRYFLRRRPSYCFTAPPFGLHSIFHFFEPLHLPATSFHLVPVPIVPIWKKVLLFLGLLGFFFCCPRLNWWPEPAAQSQQRFSRVIAPVFDACLVVAPIIRCLTCFKRRKIPFEFDVGRSSIKRTVVVLFSRRSIQHDVHLSSQHGYTSRA